MSLQLILEIYSFISVVAFIFIHFSFKLKPIDNISVKRDFKKIKKQCKGIIGTSVFDVVLSSDYTKNVNEKKYDRLRRKCLKRNWFLCHVNGDDYKLAIISESYTVDNIIANLSSVNWNNIMLKLPSDFNYDELKDKLKNISMSATNVKRYEKKGVTKFNIRPLK